VRQIPLYISRSTGRIAKDTFKLLCGNIEHRVFKENLLYWLIFYDITFSALTSERPCIALRLFPFLCRRGMFYLRSNFRPIYGKANKTSCLKLKTIWNSLNNVLFQQYSVGFKVHRFHAMKLHTVYSTCAKSDPGVLLTQ
jgi:hypothetical protein